MQLDQSHRVWLVGTIGARLRLALLGYHRTLEELDEQLHDWALKALYDLAGSIAHDDDRYGTCSPGIRSASPAD